MLTLAPLLTREQVAKRLVTDVDGVSGLIASGQLAAVNVARAPNSKRPTWRVRPEDLAEFELRRMTGTASTPRRTAKRPASKKSYF